MNNLIRHFRRAVGVALFLPLIAAAAQSYTFKRGINISHWLSQNVEALPFAAPWFDEEDVQWIARQGFDHIRLPVDFRLCLDEKGKVDPSKLKPIWQAIGWAKAEGLGLVLDAHFLPGADFNNEAEGGDRRVYTDPALIEHVATVWRDMAVQFKDEGPWLRFEILNEPVADENAQLNPFQHRMLAEIRKSNPTRIVYLTSNKWGQFANVPDVVLPDDPNVALTIHNYEPIIFTHQRASWAGLKDTLPPVTFPGEVPDVTGHTFPNHPPYGKTGDKLTVEQIQESFAKVEAWVKKTRPGLEVYVGEFGVYRPVDRQSKLNWLGAIVSECEKRGWGWAVWDYQGGFAVREQDGTGTAVLEGVLGHTGKK